MAGQLTIDTLKASTGVLATQNGMTGIAKAWVNFAGASGTVNSSFNISSITRTNTGRYTVNFTTALANANYALNISDNQVSGADNFGSLVYFSPTTTTVNLVTVNSSGAYVDAFAISVSVFSS